MTRGIIKTALLYILLSLIIPWGRLDASAAYENNNSRLIGAYSTDIGGSKKSNRAANIRRAAELIDGIILSPDELFSFNEATGPTNKANGFKEARIFIKGRDAKGYGGGVCQVSSTLYNAALDAGLYVLERHDHSKEVSYVPKGMDAAVSYGDIDLKFINSADFPIQIIAYTMNNRLYTEIYSLQ